MLGAPDSSVRKRNLSSLDATHLAEFGFGSLLVLLRRVGVSKLIRMRLECLLSVRPLNCNFAQQKSEKRVCDALSSVVDDLSTPRISYRDGGSVVLGFESMRTRSGGTVYAGQDGRAEMKVQLVAIGAGAFPDADADHDGIPNKAKQVIPLPSFWRNQRRN